MNRLERLRMDVREAFPDTFPDSTQLRVEGIVDAFIAGMRVVESEFPHDIYDVDTNRIVDVAPGDKLYIERKKEV